MTEFIGDPRRAARQLLADWQSAGITHLKPLPVSAPSTPPVAAAGPAPEQGLPPFDVPAKPVPAPPRPLQDNMLESKMSVPERESALSSLAEVVSKCMRCPELAAARTQTVFGVGSPQARVMFVGEAPGADEDAQGEPFVGRAGKLLNDIIAACGWKREELYICNILRCRPPGNRNPTPEEAANCREYLDGQIRIVDPEYIVCWGSVAAQNLLDDVTPIGKMRQRWFAYGRAKVLCTYHPSYLLRNPAAKKPVWEDMKFLLAEMGLTPPEK